MKIHHFPSVGSMLAIQQQPASAAARILKLQFHPGTPAASLLACPLQIPACAPLQGGGCLGVTVKIGAPQRGPHHLVLQRNHPGTVVVGEGEPLNPTKQGQPANQTMVWC